MREKCNRERVRNITSRERERKREVDKIEIDKERWTKKEKKKSVNLAG